ncbi:MAG: bifunctional 4-hydroxy-2-oxoglutarate aldolase/2-dehydro-3-deoxy-phosphogluconate aldolase [Hyphomicrobiaceae bacterium]
MQSAGNELPKRARLQSILRQSPIVAVITIDNAEDAVPLARALVAGGVTSLELTLRTPAGLAAAAAILREVPEAVVGVGTILTPDDLAKVLQSGAHFGVSPGITATLLEAAAASELPFMPGIQSASELMEALVRGFDIVKLFPAAALGKAAIQGLGGPFPEVRFCPTGGVGEDNFMEWLALPNVVAVGGSWMASRNDIRAGNWASITDRARRAMDKVRAGKPG